MRILQNLRQYKHTHTHTHTHTTTQVGRWNEIEVPKDGQDHKLTIVHIVDDMTQASSARANLQARGVKIWVDTCMAHQRISMVASFGTRFTTMMSNG